MRFNAAVHFEGLLSTRGVFVNRMHRISRLTALPRRKKDSEYNGKWDNAHAHEKQLPHAAKQQNAGPGIAHSSVPVPCFRGCKAYKQTMTVGLLKKSFS